MGSDDTCNTGLVLGLGLSTSSDTPKSNKGFFAAAAAAMNNNNNNNFGGDGCGEPSLTLGISGGGGDELCGRQASPHSAVSSFSNVSVKRERDHGGSSEEVEIEEEEEERDRVSRKIDEDEDFSNNNTRKKLRLTKEQSALLEDSFKLHSTLNPKQKQALARQLNLRPRQVEVWFQNRRARTKLKQTEVDCEFLKKCCETLTDENRRLQKELQELKAMKLPQPFYMQMPAATLTMCPSCERIGGNGSDGAPKTQFAIAAASKPYFFNPFTNPSAAC